MRVLQIHNSYKYIGGESTVMNLEKKLLLSKGHDVETFIVSNKSINNFLNKILVFKNIIYSKKYKNILSRKIKEYKPDIVHVHNFFPLITPSVFDSCIENKTPVIQTLHNYRIICPSAFLMHKSNIYEKAIKYGPFSTILDKAYKNSYLGTYAVARMINYHKKHDTWNKKVDRFIVLTSFAKSKFIEAGILKNKINIKSNFVDDHGFNYNKDNYYIYVGRLSNEKGINILLRAFASNKKNIKIIGEGPEIDLVQDYSRKYKNITYLGFHDKNGVIENLKNAKALVFTSVWYEGMPMTILESFSVGTPVIAPNIGAPGSIVNDLKNGLLYNVKDINDLNKTLLKFDCDKSLQSKTCKGARISFIENYTNESNYKQLISIYKKVIDEKIKTF